jgi:hypothetical protein
MEKSLRPSLVFTSKAKYHMIHKTNLIRDKHSSLFFLQTSLKLGQISLSVFSMEKPLRPSLVFTSNTKTSLKKTFLGTNTLAYSF